MPIDKSYSSYAGHANVYQVQVDGGAFVIADIVELSSEAGQRLTAETYGC